MIALWFAAPVYAYEVRKRLVVWNGSEVVPVCSNTLHVLAGSSTGIHLQRARNNRLRAAIAMGVKP